MAFPHTANSNFTHRPTTAAVLRANQFSKLILHATKMLVIARHAQQKIHRGPAEVSLLLAVRDLCQQGM